MANIFTNFLRVLPHPGETITTGEAEWIVGRVLNDRGSYNVPVSVRRPADGGLLDIQAGSMKNPDFHAFWEDAPARYAFVWERFFDEGGDFDDLRGYGPDGQESAFGPCWYGFDEVRVTAPAAALPNLGAHAAGWTPFGDGRWRAELDGRYRAGNDRTDIETAGAGSRKVEWNPPVAGVGQGGLATPTTPAYHPTEVGGVEPDALQPLVVHCYRDAARHPQVERVELLWRGRVVHRSQWEYEDACAEYEWDGRNADDWDNCLNPEYLARMRALHRGPG